VGGEDARKGEWPWQVELVRSPGSVPAPDKLSMCGGTLINGRTVVTAAHCFPHGSAPSDYKSYFVRVGNTDMKNVEVQEEMIGVSGIKLHEQWNKAKMANDIALVTLEREVKLEKQVQAVCMPEGNEPLFSCYVTGFGHISEKKRSRPSWLQQAKLSPVPIPFCREAYNDEKYKSKTIGDKQMCAGFPEGKIDSCQGDSGGPLVCEKSDGRWVLSGIVSWGVGCARAGRYGVYTRVQAYMDWLRKNTIGSFVL